LFWMRAVAADWGLRCLHVRLRHGAEDHLLHQELVGQEKRGDTLGTHVVRPAVFPYVGVCAPRIHRGDAHVEGAGLLPEDVARPSSPYAYADSYDENMGQYGGLRGGQNVSLVEEDVPGLLV